jgi:hypothetical protein
MWGASNPISGRDGSLEQSSHKLTKTKKKKNSVAFSPQANYTDRATAACQQS